MGLLVPRSRTQARLPFYVDDYLLPNRKRQAIEPLSPNRSLRGPSLASDSASIGRVVDLRGQLQSPCSELVDQNRTQQDHTPSLY